ncbi:MAG: hypothetical protein AAFQ80_10305 [Cyanobacteria bacterium J06621_8]
MATNASKTQWQYLEMRPESRRKQLYIKGSKLTAFTVWSDMLVNEMSPEEVANSKYLPIAAVKEAIVYCEANKELLEQEAKAERLYLEERGVILEPKITH